MYNIYIYIVYIILSAILTTIKQYNLKPCFPSHGENPSDYVSLGTAKCSWITTKNLRRKKPNHVQSLSCTQAPQTGMSRDRGTNGPTKLVILGIKWYQTIHVDLGCSKITHIQKVWQRDQTDRRQHEQFFVRGHCSNWTKGVANVAKRLTEINRLRGIVEKSSVWNSVPRPRWWVATLGESNKLQKKQIHRCRPWVGEQFVSNIMGYTMVYPIYWLF